MNYQLIDAILNTTIIGSVIGFGALAAVDLGTRLATAVVVNPGQKPRKVPAPMPMPEPAPSPEPAPAAEYVVEYVGYCGDVTPFEPPVEFDSLLEPWGGSFHDDPNSGWLTVRSAAPVKQKGGRGLSELIRAEVERPKDGAVATLDHGYDLPDNLRGLRQYVRDHKLHKVVKKALGKTVSKATKAELLQVLGNL